MSAMVDTKFNLHKKIISPILASKVLRGLGKPEIKKNDKFVTKTKLWLFPFFLLEKIISSIFVAACSGIKNIRDLMISDFSGPVTYRL
jgi:hypothetical protein